MGIGGSGFAYDAVCRIARATEERRANTEYWREIRSRSKHRGPSSRPPLDHRQVDVCIAAQLDHVVFLSSPRTCPECRDTFVLINVRGVELDTCLECGSFWLDAGEFGALTAHEEIITQSTPCGASVCRCPVCGDSMMQRSLASPVQIRINSCPEGHGFYFERGELLKLLTHETQTQADAHGDKGRDRPA